MGAENFFSTSTTCRILSQLISFFFNVYFFQLPPVVEDEPKPAEEEEEEVEEQKSRTPPEKPGRSPPKTRPPVVPFAVSASQLKQALARPSPGSSPRVDRREGEESVEAPEEQATRPRPLKKAPPPPRPVPLPPARKSAGSSPISPRSRDEPANSTQQFTEEPAVDDISEEEADTGPPSKPIPPDRERTSTSRLSRSSRSATSLGGDSEGEELSPRMLENRRSGLRTVLDWSTEDVEGWLHLMSMGSLTDIFEQHEIDGRQLLQLDSSKMKVKILLSSFSVHPLKRRTRKRLG